MAMTGLYTYSTAYLTASMIKYGQAQGLITQHALQGRVLHSAHTVRDKDGEDVVLLIFHPEAHAKEFGGNHPLPTNADAILSQSAGQIQSSGPRDNGSLLSEERMTQLLGEKGTPERALKEEQLLQQLKKQYGIE